jgi:hypothetical protein
VFCQFRETLVPIVKHFNNFFYNVFFVCHFMSNLQNFRV